jgi:hypothetical protein
VHHRAEDLYSGDARPLGERISQRAPADWHPLAQMAANLPQSAVGEAVQLGQFVANGLEYGAALMNYYNPIDAMRIPARRLVDSTRVAPTWQDVEALGQGLKEHYWDQGFGPLFMEGTPGPNMIKDPASYLIDGLGAGAGALKAASKAVGLARGKMLHPALGAYTPPREAAIAALKEAPNRSINSLDTAEDINKQPGPRGRRGYVAKADGSFDWGMITPDIEARQD